MNAPRATMPPPMPPKTIWSADKTLRDEFAMAALSGMLAQPGMTLDIDGAHIGQKRAGIAYALADAMLEARNANR